MSELLLARWQFLFTSTFKYAFAIAVTLGLPIIIAVMETIYVRTGQEIYKKMAQYWGKIFVILFATGVVTGIVLEFQLGMNWSEYARFMGDIFGVPLALEALTSFFLESVFLGLWLFGWDKLSKRLHLATIWLVALGSNLSAYWILVANSFMHTPVGFILRNNRAELADIGAVLTNPHVIYQYPHTVLSGWTTTAFLVMGISAYHLLRRKYQEFFRRSFLIALILGLVGITSAVIGGHLQAKFLAEAQPSKMAAAEALWETHDPAPFVLVAWIDEKAQTNPLEIKIPYLASILAHHSFSGAVKGIKDVQAEAVASYGPGHYIPPVAPIFWSFRLMVAAGLWMLFLSLYSLYLWWKKGLEDKPWVLKALLWSIPVPYLANSTGWIMAEVGRQPWTIYGLQRVEAAVSPPVSAAALWISLSGYILLYILIAAVAAYLIFKIAKKGPEEPVPDPAEEVKPWT